MSGVIRKSEAAVRDLDRTFLYYLGRNLAEGERFIEAAEGTFEQLLRWPHLGTVVRHGNMSLEGLRVWRVRGFEKQLVFYRPRDDGIDIIRVVHASRDWMWLLDLT
jgi:toxin ParE1/3/4